MGASLLAKTALQSTSMLNGLPPSRAGSLPQGIGCIPDIFHPPEMTKPGRSRAVRCTAALN
ncbi:MAG: hypothetical protein C0438_00065 [Pseudomonas sp.]|nr:hypothetical protein [Pseudomonas sp.]